jgi:hypothetical protein
MRKTLTRKRPCRICRRWFVPNPRLKDRQKTCGRPQCKREWHRKMCEKWNRENADYFRSNYLQKKLDSATGGDQNSITFQPKSRFKSGLPQRHVQEVIGIQHLVIIEYFSQLLYQRFQEVLARQMLENTS